MKQTVYRNDFHDAFVRMGRGNQFTSEGLDALYDYITQTEEDTETETELDVIAICCEFSEYENLKEFNDEYGEGCADIEEVEWLTTVIRVGEEGLIIQSY